MDRRELVKNLVALPLVTTLRIDGKAACSGTPIPAGHYLLFYDEVVVDVDGLIEGPIPENTVFTLIGLRLKSGQTIEDAIRIYKIT